MATEICAESGCGKPAREAARMPETTRNPESGPQRRAGTKIRNPNRQRRIGNEKEGNMEDLTIKDRQNRGNFRLWTEVFAYLNEFKKQFLQLLASNLLLSISLVVEPLIVAFTIDHFIEKKNVAGLYGVGGFYASFALLVSVLVYFFCRVSFRLEGRIAHKFRKEQFFKIQTLSVEYFDRTPVGSLISRMGSDTGRISEVIAWGILDFAWASGYVFFVAISMLVVHLQLALYVLAMIPPLAVVTWLISTKVIALQRQVRSVNSKMTSAISDGIYGSKTSKVLCREELNCKEFCEITGEMRAKSIHSAKWSNAYMPIPLGLSSVAVGLVLLAGGTMARNGEISIGTVSMFVAYANMMFDPILQMVDIIAQMVRAHAAAERVMELIKTEPSIVDREDVVRRYGTLKSPNYENWEEVRGDITFRNVSFCYKEGEYILKNFNLHIPKGTTVALVGKTGAGKTTIVNLACRFYEPTEGEILIDGTDYRNRSLSWLHSHLGYVLQSPFLFQGTIADNIRYGKRDASMEEVVAAAKLIRAHDFIEKLEKGYDTEVGEGGNFLSGGQKQLVSFARAVLRAPDIFVLDEATSSVDTETEQVLQEALERLLKNRTSFVVAHRLSTIKNADLILVIDEGEIAEKGTHSELMAKRGMYYKLYTNQNYEENSGRLLGGRTYAE